MDANVGDDCKLLLKKRRRGRSNRRGELVAVPGADRDALTASGAAAAEHGCTGFGLHARPEAVFLYAARRLG